VTTVLAAIIVTASVGLPLGFLGRAEPFSPELNFWPILLAAIFTVTANGCARAGAAEEGCALAILERGGSDSIGPLLETSRLPGVDQEIISRALTRLLARLQETDAALINRAQRRTLFDLLRRPSEFESMLGASLIHDWSYQSEDFQLAALGAIARLSDPAAIPSVQELAAGPTPRVQVAAEECLQALGAATALQKRASRLLRPAEPVPDLLRPAETAALRRQLLVRAQVGEVSDPHRAPASGPS
jgi:hypothetical protein